MKKIIPYYQIISCFFFSLLGLQIKLLFQESTLENIVFYRSFFGTLVLFLIMVHKREKLKTILRTADIKIHIFRSLCGMLAMYFGYKSLMYLSLAQASTIGFSKVFFTCIISSFVFTEKLRSHILFCILLGFIGIILITNPDKINSHLGVYMSLFSAICVSGGIISISYLSKKDSTMTILFYHSLFSSLIFFIIFNHKIIFGNNFLIFKYLILTVTALIGQFFNTESYKNDLTQKVVILGYSRIIFSTILGAIILDDQISWPNLLGISIVILTTFLVQKK